MFRKLALFALMLAASEATNTATSVNVCVHHAEQGLENLTGKNILRLIFNQIVIPFETTTFTQSPRTTTGVVTSGTCPTSEAALPGNTIGTWVSSCTADPYQIKMELYLCTAPGGVRPCPAPGGEVAFCNAIEGAENERNAATCSAQLNLYNPSTAIAKNPGTTILYEYATTSTWAAVPAVTAQLPPVAGIVGAVLCTFRPTITSTFTKVVGGFGKYLKYPVKYIRTIDTTSGIASTIDFVGGLAGALGLLAGNPPSTIDNEARPAIFTEALTITYVKKGPALTQF